MSKKTLNKANLEALGASCLADLLIEVSTGSADIKRRLRLELSHTLGASELAHDVRKRLVSLRKSTSFVGWRKRKALIRDLDTQVTMITKKIAPDDPTVAFDLLWEFLELAPSIYERVDDSRGDVGDVFRAAMGHFDRIAPHAHLAPAALADRIWAAQQDNGYGQWDGLLPVLAPSLGPAGLSRLKACVGAYASEPGTAAGDHAAIRFLHELRGGDRYVADRNARFVKSCLQEIAAVAGDTGAYIAQFTDDDLRRTDIAAEVAQLLCADGQAARGLDALLSADEGGTTAGRGAWDAAYIACLVALGRTDAAQSHRWACFEATLALQHLRDYLKELPDFDDVEAEERAKQRVMDFPDMSASLAFCLDWPDLLTAAHIVEARAGELNGDSYSLLTPAAEALRQRHKLAAVLIWRAMIDYVLGQGRATRYGHAADHLADCAVLDAEISDYGAFQNHARYLAGLQTRHDRKTSFWTKVHRS